MEAYILPALIVVVTILAVAALVINSKAAGSNRAQIAGLIESASLAKGSSDFEQAKMLYSRALDLIEGMKPIDEVLLSECLVNYATVLDRLGERTESEKIRKRLLTIWNRALEEGNSELTCEVDYLCVNQEFGAQTLDVANYYERLLAQREKTHAPESDVFINTVVIYARLMRTLGEKDIAADLEAHAQNLREGAPKEITPAENEDQG